MTQISGRRLSIGNPQISRDIVKRPPFHDPPVRVWLHFVVHPLPDVPKHIEEPIPVGSFRAHRMSGVTAVSVVPGDVIERPISGSRVTSRSSELPLRFGGKAHANRIAIGPG